MRALLASLTWSNVRGIFDGLTTNRQHRKSTDDRSNDIVQSHPMMRGEASAVGRKSGLPANSPLRFLPWNITAGIKNKCTMPQLKIRSINQAKDVVIWKHHITAWKRKFITVKVENTRMKTATRCSAKLTFTMIPPNVSHLKREYNLRWIGSNQSGHGDDTGSIHISKGLRRLEIVFSDSDEALKGCWIACAEAFSDTEKSQVFLPAGIYHAVLTITCENGKGAVKKYKIISPLQWEKVRVLEMK